LEEVVPAWNLVSFHQTFECWDEFLSTNLEYIFESDLCFNIYNRHRNIIFYRIKMDQSSAFVYLSHTESSFQRWRRVLNLTDLTIYCIALWDTWPQIWFVDDFGSYPSHVYVSRASSSMVVKLHTTNILQVFMIHTLKHTRKFRHKT
jgi:hypothetical protein